MKSLVFFCLSLFSLAAQSAEKMDMTCVTEFPTTSFVIRELNDKVTLQILNHNGSVYMPIFDGLATPNDMSQLVSKANLLRKLPSIMTFEWPREKCEIQDEMIQGCMGSTTTQELNDVEVSAWAFSSAWSVDKTVYGKFNSRKVTLNLTVEGQSHSIPMKYQEEECAPYAMMVQKLKNAQQ